MTGALNSFRSWGLAAAPMALWDARAAILRERDRLLSIVPEAWRKYPMEYDAEAGPFSVTQSTRTGGTLIFVGVAEEQSVFYKALRAAGTSREQLMPAGDLTQLVTVQQLIAKLSVLASRLPASPTSTAVAPPPPAPARESQKPLWPWIVGGAALVLGAMIVGSKRKSKPKPMLHPRTA